MSEFRRMWQEILDNYEEKIEHDVKDCNDCPFFQWTEVYCSIDGCEHDFPEEVDGEPPDWCPLRGAVAIVRLKK